MDFPLGERPPPAASSSKRGEGLFLGGYIDGDEALPVVKDKVILPLDLLTTHIAIIGVTGSGKTSTARTIFEGVSEADRRSRKAAGKGGIAGKEGLSDKETQIFFFDGNADPKMAALFGASLSATGEPPLFFPQERFNAWPGDWQAVFNRFLDMIPFAQQGSAAYFTDAETVILQLACRMYGRPPQSYKDLADRLDYVELRLRFGADSLRGVEPEFVDALKMRIDAVFTHIGNGFDGARSFADLRSAYFSLSSLSMGKSAVTAMRALLSQLSYYIECEKDPARKCIVVLDEFAAFAGDVEVGAFIEQARKHNVCVILLSQTVIGIGEPKQMLRVLENANLVLVHNSAAWTELERFIGAEEIPDVTWRYDGQGRIESEMSRLVERTKVARSDFLRLPLGYVWVLRRNDAMLVDVELPETRRGPLKPFELPKQEEMFDVPEGEKAEPARSPAEAKDEVEDASAAAGAQSKEGSPPAEGSTGDQGSSGLPPAESEGLIGDGANPPGTWGDSELPNGPGIFSYADVLENDSRKKEEEQK